MEAKAPRFPVVALVIALFAILVAAARFDILPTRDDTWVFDRSSKRICTLGFEAVEPPCWPAVAVALSRLRLARPNGGDWTVNASGLLNVAGLASGPCDDATVWYADNARNLFLSDGHAYAVKAPLPLPFRDAVRVCAYPGRPGLYAVAHGRDVAPAVRMR